MNKFYYSYVMGVDDSIYELENESFDIEKVENDYFVMFPKDKTKVWEEFISKHLKSGFWNEYVGDCITFIFKFKDGTVKRYLLDDSNEEEILELCCSFADTKFVSIRNMLLENEFYKDKI